MVIITASQVPEYLSLHKGGKLGCKFVVSATANFENFRRKNHLTQGLAVCQLTMIFSTFCWSADGESKINIVLWDGGKNRVAVEEFFEANLPTDANWSFVLDKSASILALRVEGHKVFEPQMVLMS